MARRRPSWASEITSLTPRNPRLVRPLIKPDQNGSASDGPMPRPTISRRPSVFTATAIICRDRDDAAAVADLEVGGIKPEIRPFALERPVEEGIDPLVDVLAQL